MTIASQKASINDLITQYEQAYAAIEPYSETPDAAIKAQINDALNQDLDDFNFLKNEITNGAIEYHHRHGIPKVKETEGYTSLFKIKIKGAIIFDILFQPPEDAQLAKLVMVRAAHPNIDSIHANLIMVRLKLDIKTNNFKLELDKLLLCLTNENEDCLGSFQEHPHMVKSLIALVAKIGNYCHHCLAFDVETLTM